MYYKFPTLLIKDKKYRQLSNDAKLLYMYLFARCELSDKNGWRDDEGKTYIYCNRESMARFLGLSMPTTVKMFNQLVNSGLVRAVKKERSSSARLYVKNLLSSGELIKDSSDSNENDNLREILFKKFMEM